MLKVFCEEFEALKPVALMLGTSLYDGVEKKKKLNGENNYRWLSKLKTRLVSMFK